MRLLLEYVLSMYLLVCLYVLLHGCFCHVILYYSSAFVLCTRARACFGFLCDVFVPSGTLLCRLPEPVVEHVGGRVLCGLYVFNKLFHIPFIAFSRVALRAVVLGHNTCEYAC